MNKELYLKNFKNKNIAFCGLGASNTPLINFFKKLAKNIIVCDKQSKEFFPENLIQYFDEKDIILSFGKNYLDGIKSADIVFRTPGMSFFMEELNLARENHIVVTSEMEVFFELCPCKIIGITGSDGKTTTTTIISEMLKTDGKNVHTGGNIGKPLFPLLNKINQDDFVVVELSSFQLISMSKSPDISIITNVEPNHLDIHKNMDEYINAKKNIFLHQSAFSKTILNYDNEITKNFASEIRAKKMFFSAKKILKKGVYLKNNEIYYNEEKIINSDDIKIPGEHNTENFLASIAVIRNLVNVNSIIKVAKKFEGIEHRLEFVREINEIKYYNDSIASSPTRTIKGALSLFPSKIILIAGGYDKKIPFSKFGDAISKKVKLLILLGQTSDAIEQAVKGSNYYDKDLKIIKVNNMYDAVSESFKNASPGDIVSLSPACASFDIYKNFDERGKHFKKIVRSIQFEEFNS